MEIRTHSLAHDLQQAAFSLGFPLFGVTSAKESPGYSKFCEWLELGYAGGMQYLGERQEAYRHPSSILADAATLIMLGMPYEPAASLRRGQTEKRTSGAGRVAAYASGTRDYHDVIHERLKNLAKYIVERFPQAAVRGVVDTASLLERDFAALAGLGWIGKNTLLLNKTAGSYFFLAALLTNIEIDFANPIVTDHCGTCTACLDACPTQAFPHPHVLDATRCISYLTIEHRGSIPLELRTSIDDWVFGCDICQQVCPWNRMAKPTSEESFRPDANIKRLELIELLSLNEDGFRKKFRKTPLWRARRVGLQRNAMIVLGNQRVEQAFPVIVQFLSSDDVTLRRTAAWAIGRINAPQSKTILQTSLEKETNEEVRCEIQEALMCLRTQ